MPAPRQPRPVKINTTPLFLFFGLVALLAVILALIGRVNKKQIEVAEAEAKKKGAMQAASAGGNGPTVDPFADLPDEVGLGLGARGSRWASAFPRDPDPTGLEAESIWQEALNQADAAWALADDARQALEAEDKARFKSKGLAARIAFEKAIEATAQWEKDIIQAHGETDSKVRKIIRTRNEWDEQIAYYRTASGY